MTLESEVVTDSADVIGTVRHTVFAYEPMPARQGTEDAGKSSTESKGSEREMAFESSPIANLKNIPAQLLSSFQSSDDAIRSHLVLVVMLKVHLLLLQNFELNSSTMNAVMFFLHNMVVVS